MELTVTASEIATLLDRAPPGITTLSLDCFDTLMWRDVNAPKDVFAGIAAPGGGLEPRQWAESTARRQAKLRTGSAEVTLHHIYERMLHGHPAETIEAAVAHEVMLETRHLFPFAPTVELMRAARARGLKIILVSDMYLTEDQLRHILSITAGDAVLGLIDRIFMSSAHGRSKANGLFEIVLRELGAKPNEIIHVGDNKAADFEGAKASGIHAVLFRQFEDKVVQRLRLEAAAGIMLDPAIRVSVPAHQPHRASISMRTEADTAYEVGHDVMGPVMHAFATWLKADIDTLSARLGKPVRPLFLMRDGYLPFRAFDTLYPEIGARPVEISRLSAARASLHDEAAVEAFLAEYLDTLPASAIAKQLMLFDHEVAKLIRKQPNGKFDDKPFRHALKQKEWIAKIVKRSRNFTDRMMAHLRLNDVKDGDAVMLVDIGYKGTVQNIVTPVLQREMNLDVSGRYVFLREECISTLDKKGLLGTDMFECRALHALGTCVAVVEQMCNIAQGSTIDYHADGQPIREESGLKSFQNASRDRIQAACLDYVRANDAAMLKRPASDDMTARRRMAGSILTRLLFMPLDHEIELFTSFDHDVNLGTKVMIPLLDHEEAAEGLRRRGIAYVNETRRMYVPGEIARHGVPYLLSLLTTSRFALDMRNSDFLVGGLEVPVILMGMGGEQVTPFTAHPTHEGFYRIAIPVPRSRPLMAIQLGKDAEMLQIESVSYSPLKEFDSNWVADMVDADHMVDGMTEIAPGMYQANETGLVIVPPPPLGRDNLVLSIIFRPLRWRGEEARKAALKAERQGSKHAA